VSNNQVQKLIFFTLKKFPLKKIHSTDTSYTLADTRGRARHRLASLKLLIPFPIVKKIIK